MGTPMKKRYFLAAGLIVAGIAVLRPVPRPTAENTYRLKATVARVWEGQGKDINFLLEAGTFPRRVYINRGAEQGYSADSLQRLVGRPVTFTLIRHWTPLDWQGKTGYVAAIE